MQDIIEQAHKELDEELRREAIEKAKVNLRMKRVGIFRRFWIALKTQRIVIKLEKRK